MWDYLLISICCANDNNQKRNPLNLPSKKNNPKQHKYQTPEKAHANNNLTRFGLDAYVLGARKGEGFY